MRLARLVVCPALAVLVLSNVADAQSRPEVSAGFGLGTTHSGSPNPTMVDMVAFASVKSPVKTAAIVRSKYANVLVSIHPFIGPRAGGGTAWVVPILLGLSR